MIDFDFINPTRIIFGKGKENEVGTIIKGYGFHKVMLVYGGGSIKRNGLYERVVSSLTKENVSFVELSGVRPNPVIEKVREGVATARKEGVELILAVGGGSSIDTSKCIAAGFYYDGDPFDFNTHKVAPTKTLPVGVILTHASAGSEMSTSCVIQDDEKKVKSGFNSDLNRPLFAIENPELTYTVSPYQTAAGICDSMMHTLERYFSPSDSMQLADEWALGLLKNLMQAGKAVMENPTDYEARGAVMLASSFAHNGLTHIGKEFGFVVHPLEHVLSAYKPDITHGAGIALIYPAWAKRVYHDDCKKFAKLARYLFDIDINDDEKASIIGIDAMKNFFASLGMPTTLEEVGLSAKDVAPLSNLATGNGTRVVGRFPKPLQKQDVEAIYSSLASKE